MKINMFHSINYKMKKFIHAVDKLNLVKITNDKKLIDEVVNELHEVSRLFCNAKKLKYMSFKVGKYEDEVMSLGVYNKNNILLLTETDSENEKKMTFKKCDFSAFLEFIAEYLSEIEVTEKDLITMTTIMNASVKLVDDVINEIPKQNDFIIRAARVYTRKEFTVKNISYIISGYFKNTYDILAENKVQYYEKDISSSISAKKAIMYTCILLLIVTLLRVNTRNLFLGGFLEKLSISLAVIIPALFIKVAIIKLYCRKICKAINNMETFIFKN